MTESCIVEGCSALRELPHRRCAAHQAAYRRARDRKPPAGAKALTGMALGHVARVLEQEDAPTHHALMAAAALPPLLELDERLRGGLEWRGYPQPEAAERRIS